MANYNWYTEGKVTVTNGSTEVTASGTTWQLHAKPGDMLAVTNGGPAKELYEILSIESNTKLTLASPYQGTSESAAEYAILRNFTGVWSIAARQAQEIQDLLKRFNIALRENLRGDQGAPGKDGKTVLGGNGAPSSAIGTDSDWYLDMATWGMFRREGGAWTLRGSLTGPKGEPGKDGVQWYYDETPSDSLGNIGDINFNGLTGDIHKRTLTGWLQIGNFKGPKGETGSKGDTGAKGDKGDPARWYSGSGVPAVSTGANGDMYLNSLSGDVYRKASDVWVQQGNIKGRIGEQGPIGPAGLNFNGAWSASAPYEPRDAVLYNGNVWIARIANVGVTPPSTKATASNEAWNLLVPKGDDGLGSGDMRMAVYDPEGTGVVEKAKQAERAQSAETATKASSVPWVGVEDAPTFATFEGVNAAITDALETFEVPSSVEVLDTLDSDRPDAALSAAQGQKLKDADTAIAEALNEKAEAEHQHEIADVEGLSEALQVSGSGLGSDGLISGELGYVSSRLPEGKKGAFEYVEGLGLFQFDEGAEDLPDGETCILPESGPGRWLLALPHCDILWTVRFRDNYAMNQSTEELKISTEELKTSTEELKESVGLLQKRLSIKGSASITWTALGSYGGTQRKTLTVPGAEIGDGVVLVPPAVLADCISFYGYVSAADTVTVCCVNSKNSTVTPAVGVWTAIIIKAV